MYLFVISSFLGNCDGINCLPKIFQQVIADVIETINVISHEIVNFNADIGLLQVIKGKEKTLCDLYAVIEDNNSSSVTVEAMSNSMEKATLILDRFNTFKSCVQYILNLCVEFVGGVGMFFFLKH